MTTRTWKQRLSALILALTLTFDVAAQGLVCFADTAETVPETTVATEPTVPEITIPETTVPVEPVNEEPTVPETTMPEETVPETTVPEETVSETTVPEETVPETTVPEETVPETTVPEETVPETTVPEETVPETTVPEETIPESTVPETTVSEETEPEETEPPMMAPAPEEDTLYTRMLAAEDLQAMHDAMMATPAEMFSMTAEELTALRAHAEELYATLETPSTDDEDYYALLIDTVDMLLGELEMEEPEVLPEDGIIEFDLAKGSVVLLDSGYSGYDSEGNSLTGEHKETHIYIITQSGADSTKNTISVGQSKSHCTTHPDPIDRNTPVTTNFTVVLNGVNVNMGTGSANYGHCAFSVNNGGGSTVAVILENNSTNFLSSGRCRAGLEKHSSAKGRLVISCRDGYEAWSQNNTSGHTDADCFSGCRDHCGALTVYGGGSDAYHAGAGIGTAGYGTTSHSLYNLTIAGGKITARGARGNTSSSGGGAGIGAGCARTSSTNTGEIENFYITGGTIIAYRGDNSAANIGGGYRSGYANVTIYGGTITATERGDNTNQARMRAAAIGGGGGGTTSACPAGATVNIYGGDITAYGQYGSAIGAGAGGSSGGGKESKVNIYGGNITASTEAGDGAGAAIGSGGSLGSGVGGAATVNIIGGTVNVRSEFGAAIGGGGTQSTENHAGGAGTVNISGGTITVTNESAIGGGRAKGGKGGSATVTITGGTVNGYSIGGGDSESGDGGDATVNISGEKANLTLTNIIGGGNSVSKNGGDASVTVSGGYMKSLAIGGGNTESQTALGGSVVSADGTAGIKFSGGTVLTGQIGGGSNGSGEVGYASALVEGGDIRGQFVMKASEQGACTFTMTGGIIHNTDLYDSDYTHSVKLGGAVYMDDPNGVVNISGGTIDNCQANDGGAVYMTAGVFDLSGTAMISNCKALVKESVGGNGGAIYLGSTTVGGTTYNGTFTMSDGTISRNKAESGYGGGIYLDGGNATISGGTIGASNIAKNGGGAYLNGGLLTLSGTGAFTGNTATVDGGGFYVNGGNFLMENGSIQDNSAPNGNGGGGAVNNGIFTMKDGSIGDETTGTVDGQTVILPSNTAKNGGGVYVSGGSADISGGTIQYNRAENGGGAYITAGDGVSGALNLSGNGSFVGNTATVDGGGFYVSGGNFNMENGTIHSNTAAANGGGGVVQGGNFTMNNGTIGGRVVDGETVTLLSNTADNGGGVYVSGGNFRMNDGSIVGNTASENGGGINVADGNVTIVYGAVDHNTAKNGGGMMVTAMKQSVNVIMLSGSLSNNHAVENGGGMTVDGGSADNQIDIAIGCLLQHDVTKLTADKKWNPVIAYTEDYAQYAEDGHSHVSCPVVQNNSCTDIGGGFYLASPNAKLNFHCVIESGNTASGSNTNCWGMDVQGGTVSIGDSKYHNINNTTDTTNRGYIQMGSTILVEGGNVNIYGNMDNPYFAKEITVDIQLDASGNPLGAYTDHRRNEPTDKNPSYKVHYVENFPESETVRTGLYIAEQYSNDEAKAVTINGAMFYREGYTIVGWFIDQEGNQLDKEYKVGTTYDLTYVDDPNSEQDKPFEGSEAPPKDSIGITQEGCDDDNQYCESQDPYLLKLYAKWVLNGYRVLFDPGISDGSYTGAMDPQTFTYYEEKQLSENQFVYPGWEFNGWKDSVDSSKIYVNKQLVSKLAIKNGQEITLVAQWKKCEHTGDWSYAADGNVITASCVNCGYEETLTLEAQSTIYDGQAHPATLRYSVEEGFCPVWFGRTTTEAGTIVTKKVLCEEIDYTAKKIGNNTVDPTVADGGPTYAGQYTASVTAGATAKIEYCIEKAPHPVMPTKKPDYTVDAADNTKISVKGIEEKGVVDFPMDAAELNNTSNASDEYRLVYYDMTNDKWVPGSEDWKDDKNWPDMPTEGVLQLTAHAEWKNYRVEARFAETYNYMASEPVQSNGTYFFSGNVEVKIVCDDHISATFEGSGSDQQITSAKLKMVVESGYFLVNDQFVITGTVEQESGAPLNTVTTNFAVDPVAAKGKGQAIFEVSKINIDTGSATRTVVTICIGTAQPMAVVKAVATERKLYNNVVDEDAVVSISNDSAFTAYFRVNSYDTKVKYQEMDTNVYESPVLLFRSAPQTEGDDPTPVALPVGTTILMMDMTQVDAANRYWYYQVNPSGNGQEGTESYTGVTDVALADFIKMGDASQKHSLNAVSTLEYQFILDFSQCEKNAYLTGSFEMVLSVEKKSQFAGDAYAYIPEPNAAVTVNLEPTAFTLQEIGTGVLSKTLKMTYDPGYDAASRWDGRGSALRLEFEGDVNSLPEDVYIKAVSGKTTVTVFPGKTDGVFLIPLSMLAEGDKEVSLTLMSEKFPVESKDYAFGAEWLISNSAASKAPLTGNSVISEIIKGEQTDKTCTVIFSKPLDTEVAVKILGEKRIVTIGERFEIEVQSKGLSEAHEVTVELEKKQNGTYSGFAVYYEMPENNNGTISVNRLQGPGDYRVKITIMQTGGFGIVLDDIFYYFIAEAPQTVAATT